MIDYDIDMKVIRNRDNLDKQLIKHYAGIDAAKKAERMGKMIRDLDDGIRKNREYIKQLALQVNKHPEYFQHEIDEMKGTYRQYKNKLDNVRSMLAGVNKKIAEVEGYMRSVQKSPGFSPAKTTDIKSTERELDNLKAQKKDLEGRAAQLMRSMEGIEERLG